MPKKEIADNHIHEQVSSRLMINTRLLGVAITIFVLIVTLKSEILTDNKIITYELVLAIPFLLTSSLARSKLGYSSRPEKWNFLGWITYIIGYALLLNVIGIIVALYLDLNLAILFFVISWILSIVYSTIEVSYKKEKLKERIFKDSFFILLQLFLGLLPALRII